MPTAFSDDWARAWCAALNASQAYQAAAASWEGSVALAAIEQDSGRRNAVFLDLHHGACRAARAATDADVAGAAYLIEAPPSVWRAVLDSQTSPAMALLSGRLKLIRGELAKLLPHANSARELLHIAATIDHDFPEGW